jgi:hypothetical protein
MGTTPAYELRNVACHFHAALECIGKYAAHKKVETAEEGNRRLELIEAVATAALQEASYADLHRLEAGTLRLS